MRPADIGSHASGMSSRLIIQAAIVTGGDALTSQPKDTWCRPDPSEVCAYNNKGTYTVVFVTHLDDTRQLAPGGTSIRARLK